MRRATSAMSGASGRSRVMQCSREEAGGSEAVTKTGGSSIGARLWGARPPSIARDDASAEESMATSRQSWTTVTAAPELCSGKFVAGFLRIAVVRSAVCEFHGVMTARGEAIDERQRGREVRGDEHRQQDRSG